MLTQTLQTASLSGLGAVLPGPPESDGWVLTTLPALPGPEAVRYRSERELIVDYAAGMPLLILYPPDGPRVFYLDRAVQLSAGTLFSVFPLGSGCAARLYARPGAPAAESGSVGADFLNGAVPQLSFGRIMTFFDQDAAGDFYFRGESHEAYELVLVDQGKLHNLVNGQDVSLVQQELLIIGSGVWHMQFSDVPVRFLTISFELSGDSLAPVVGKRLALPARLRPVMESMLRERADPGLCSYDCLAALLQLLLIGLLREEASGKKSPPAPLPATQRAEHRIVEQALRLLADRAGRKLSLRELAAALNVSVPYLCRLFDEHLGMPPGRYISKIRLEECKALLREGELSMGEIAGQMGFSSAQHFSRQFRQWFGMTPTQYARSLR